MYNPNIRQANTQGFYTVFDINFKPKVKDNGISVSMYAAYIIANSETSSMCFHRSFQNALL